MTLLGKDKASIEQLENDLIKKLKSLGGTAGNVTMVRTLGWQEEDYWATRDRLVDAGLLFLGRGKGGSIRYVESTPIKGSLPEAIEETALPRENEDALYEPMAKVLETKWARDNRFEKTLVEITARQGRKETGGRWSRPDITVLSMSVFPFVPGKHFDVTTFEIKTFDGIDLTCIYEALAHRRAANRAFVLLHIPESHANTDWFAPLLTQIEEEAKRHGIGVIVASDPSNYETWEESVEARRHDPAPEKTNDFLAIQLSEGAKEKIITWFRY